MNETHINKKIYGGRSSKPIRSVHLSPDGNYLCETALQLNSEKQSKFIGFYKMETTVKKEEGNEESSLRQVLVHFEHREREGSFYIVSLSPFLPLYVPCT